MIALLFELFSAFFKIGLFSFGGGYAMLPFMQEQTIDVHGWLTTSEFLDMLGIAQVTPGPISINTATFVGYDVLENAGFGMLNSILGGVIATFAVVLPSFIIVLAISFFFEKFKKSRIIENIFQGLRPIVLGLVASAAVDIGRDVFIDFKAVVISILIFYLITFRKMGTITLLVLAGILGVLFY